ncbi:nitroreductase [Streptococcus merionis]|uniref:nitroreductase n=1 Tax=Streptococcus merionis TaxID=400065 RepID=UPI0026F3377B|nr:nitroreductase [Streptococcus merionis]
MEFSQALNNRKSIRWFKDQSVKLEDIQTILTEAQLVPNWVNSQPWKVYVAIGQTLEQIKAQHLTLKTEKYSSSPTWSVMSRMDWQEKPRKNMVDWSKGFHAHLNEEMWISQEVNDRLYNAQAIMYFALPKNATAWSHYDLGSFVTTAMLSAADKGIDSMAAYEYIMFTDQLIEILPIDEDYNLIMGVGLGYRDETHILNRMPRVRESLDDFLTILK